MKIKNLSSVFKAIPAISGTSFWNPDFSVISGISTNTVKYSIAFFLLLATFQYSNGQNSLEYYVGKAQTNSPLINEYKNSAKINRLESERLRVLYTKPQVEIAANYLLSPIITTDNNQTKLVLNPENAINYYGYDLSYSNGGQYQAMLNVTQPVFNGHRFQTLSEQLNVASQINHNSAQFNAHDIEKMVADQYILCLQDSKQVAFAKAMINLLADHKKILEKLVANSLYKQSDLRLLVIEQQNFMAQLIVFKASYLRDLMDLNMTCGIKDTTMVELQVSRLVLNDSVGHSGFLEKYRLDSMNLEAQQKASELKYKPQINLFANTGLNAVYAPTLPKRFGLSAGISFIYYLWDGNQREINRGKTQLMEESILFYKENFITQNMIRKAKIINEVQSIKDRISIAEQQLQEFDLLLNSYKKEIALGQLSIINYITVLKNMAMAQRDYIMLFSQQQSLINEYNYWNW